MNRGIKNISLILVVVLALSACGGNTAGNGKSVSGSAAGNAAGFERDTERDVERQLRLLAENRLSWMAAHMTLERDEDEPLTRELLEEYLEDNSARYAVTDLDQNGQMEILVANVLGSGHFSYNAIYTCEGDSVQRLDYGIGYEKKNDGMILDIEGVETTPVYYDEEGKAYGYEFCDSVSGGSGSGGSASGVLTLKDHEVYEKYYGDMVMEEGEMHYTVAEKECKKNEYGYLLHQAMAKGKKEGTATFGWCQTGEDFAEISDEKLYEYLRDSWREFRVEIHSTTLQISAGSGEKADIPDPAETTGDAVISLPRGDDREWEDYSDEERAGWFADLSFAGFDRPVFVPIFHVVSLAAGDDSGARIFYTDTGKQKTTRGSCLILYVIDGAKPDESEIDIAVHSGAYGENEKNGWFVVLDYGSGRCYKAKTGFEWYNDDDFRFSAADFTGDGQKEWMVKDRYNKWYEAEVFRLDEKTGEMVQLFTTWGKEDGGDLFSLSLADDYKVVMKCEEIGYSQTVSMLDAGYSLEQLQWDNGRTQMRTSTLQPMRLWKDGKLVRSEVDPDTVFMSPVNKVQTEKDGEKPAKLKLTHRVYVGHRSAGVGTMYLYFQYDEEKDALVPSQVEFELDSGEKDWFD